MADYAGVAARPLELCFRRSEQANILLPVLGTFKENYPVPPLPRECLGDGGWIRTDTREADNAVDFFVKIRGMSFLETMRLLLA